MFAAPCRCHADETTFPRCFPQQLLSRYSRWKPPTISSSLAWRLTRTVQVMTRTGCPHSADEPPLLVAQPSDLTIRSADDEAYTGQSGVEEAVEIVDHSGKRCAEAVFALCGRRVRPRRFSASLLHLSHFLAARFVCVFPKDVPEASGASEARDEQDKGYLSSRQPHNFVTPCSGLGLHQGRLRFDRRIVSAARCLLSLSQGAQHHGAAESALHGVLLQS